MSFPYVVSPSWVSFSHEDLGWVRYLSVCVSINVSTCVHIVRDSHKPVDQQPFVFVTHTYIYTYIKIYLHIFMCAVYTLINIYIYMYICLCVYIYMHIYIYDICNKYAENSFKYSKSIQLILFHWRHTETRAAGSLDKAWMTGDLGIPHF
jgi:hypothetical protein